MTDSLSPAERSVRMGMVRAKNTKPELLVRSIVHRLGYRYRLHAKDLPGRPDLVFRSRKKVIFVHGCFWHRHDDPQCTRTRFPTSNQSYWLSKFKQNIQRDMMTRRRLEEGGWTSLTVWECQLADRDQLKQALVDFLETL